MNGQGGWAQSRLLVVSAVGYQWFYNGANFVVFKIGSDMIPWGILREPLGLRQINGIVLGFAGLALMAFDTSSAGGFSPLGATLALTGSASWAAGSLWAGWRGCLRIRSWRSWCAASLSGNDVAASLCSYRLIPKTIRTGGAPTHTSSLFKNSFDGDAFRSMQGEKHDCLGGMGPLRPGTRHHQRRSENQCSLMENDFPFAIDFSPQRRSACMPAGLLQ
jgi:hypothetical protein